MISRQKVEVVVVGEDAASVVNVVDVVNVADVVNVVDVVVVKLAVEVDINNKLLSSKLLLPVSQKRSLSLLLSQWEIFKSL